VPSFRRWRFEMKLSPFLLVPSPHTVCRIPFELPQTNLNRLALAQHPSSIYRQRKEQQAPFDHTPSDLNCVVNRWVVVCKIAVWARRASMRGLKVIEFCNSEFSDL
jgi:hypothetical protein